MKLGTGRGGGGERTNFGERKKNAKKLKPFKKKKNITKKGPRPERKKRNGGIRRNVEEGSLKAKRLTLRPRTGEKRQKLCDRGEPGKKGTQSIQGSSLTRAS